VSKKIVGICGPKTVGKSYLASSIRHGLVNYKVEIMSFATPIKEVVGVSDNKEKLRIKYQQYGDMKRKENKAYFVDIVRNKISNCDADIIVLDDIRYQNEADICDILIELSSRNVIYTNEHSSEVGGLRHPDTITMIRDRPNLEPLIERLKKGGYYEE
jgi:broad-specificity NMP kinase